MLQLLYAFIFGEMFVIVSFLFKTPVRKLAIVTVDRIKRGRGPLLVKSVAATFVVVLASSLYSISKIQRRFLQAPLNPTDQVLVSNHMLQASLLGFVLFLLLIIDRLHHYIRELRLLRKAMEAAKKQSRSFEDGKSVSAAEHKALLEEIAMLKPKIKTLESECGVKASKAMALEAEVEALRKQSEGFLMEYDRLLADNQNLRSQLQVIDHKSSHSLNKKSM
ncbi:hypothetical protein Fmac_019429 [Flemingia macrophylla]|uniref:Endoplasmic reticulum transmembrane protein n=1 Tax=Flemingia macrophylla TaxID=520843 RepID=A0ABD1M8H2_9FABA